MGEQGKSGRRHWPVWREELEAKRLGKAETKEPFSYSMLKVPALSARCIETGNGGMCLGFASGASAAEVI
jgi:hypothetical protein